MSDLETQLTAALRGAARREILRKPSSAAQFSMQTKETQIAIVDAFAAWVLPTVIPIIDAYIEETHT